VKQEAGIVNEEMIESPIKLKLNVAEFNSPRQGRRLRMLYMFSLKNTKATGPNGFNASFFKRMWHIVGEDVINTVKSFFQTRRMLKEM
jgi:transposase